MSGVRAWEGGSLKAYAATEFVTLVCNCVDVVPQIYSVDVCFCLLVFCDFGRVYPVSHLCHLMSHVPHDSLQSRGQLREARIISRALTHLFVISQN